MLMTVKLDFVGAAEVRTLISFYVCMRNKHQCLPKSRSHCNRCPEHSPALHTVLRFIYYFGDVSRMSWGKLSYITGLVRWKQTGFGFFHIVSNIRESISHVQGHIESSGHYCDIVLIHSCKGTTVATFLLEPCSPSIGLSRARLASEAGDSIAQNFLLYWILCMKTYIRY